MRGLAWIHYFCETIEQIIQGTMRIIVPVMLLAWLAVGCGSSKRVYAPPFDDEGTTTVATTETAVAQTQTTTQGAEEKPVVTREEKVTMTHGDVMKRYNIIVGSFANEDYAVRLREKLVGEGYHSIIMLNEKGMRRVSIAGFDEEAPARSELLRIREQRPEFADAWLLISK